MTAPPRPADDRLRILLLNQTFHPDETATAQHAHDLAAHLVRAGHSVTVVASRGSYGRRGAQLPWRSVVDGVEVRRTAANLFGKSGLGRRALDGAIFLALAALRDLGGARPDVVVSLTSPPLVGLAGEVIARRRGARHVHWVMDLHPDVAIACAGLDPRSATARILRAIQRRLLSRASAVVVLGRCMRERVLALGVPDPLVRVIRPWADARELSPPERGTNACRAEWGIGPERFVALYSGNLGLGHDVATLAGAARILRDHETLRVVLSATGQRTAGIDEEVASGAIQRVAPVPRSRLAELLGAADVHLASLLPAAEGTMVPSKVFGAMASGRPTVFVGPAGSEVARLLVEGRCGLVVEPGDVQGLVAALEGLAADPAGAAAMGARGRDLLRSRHDRAIACAEWQALLEADPETRPVV